MKQITYAMRDHTFEEMAEAITNEPVYTTATDRLLIVLEPEGDRERIRTQLADARAALPGTKIVGLTTMGALAPSIEVPTCIVCTCLLFERSEVHVDVYDFDEMAPHEAGRLLCDAIDGYEDAQGVLVVSSNNRINLQPFVDELILRHANIPFFGTHAGSQSVFESLETIFVDDELYESGVFAVTFCGQDLHILPSYNLGWRAIGNEHVITSCETNGMVHTIDNMPAVQVYQHYLQVDLDEYFFANVCPFPLVMRDGDHLVARVPIDYTEEGWLRFPTAFERGSHARLSYAHPDDLMRNSIASANELTAFGPDALVLFSCENRRVFLGNEGADKEIGFYFHACPDLAWGYGAGEIMHTPEGGGLLNSTIVAFGLREGEPSTEVREPLSFRDGTGSVIPLSERLATFLDATTAELNQTIAHLEGLAKRDPLTGAVNRRRIDELLHYELSKRRRQNDLMLLMYDIDFFKDVNDTYGHDVGDIVLKDLTRCVQSCLREGDTLGRWGGEEFLCLLTDLSLEDAVRVAERIRTRVAGMRLLRVGHVTISVGVTAAHPSDTPESFFQRVDKALYDAKHAGRNCVRVR